MLTHFGHPEVYILILFMVFVLWMLVRALWHFYEKTNPIPQRIVHGTTIFILVVAFRITILGVVVKLIYVCGGLVGFPKLLLDALLCKAAALSVIRWGLTFVLPPGVAQLSASLLTALFGSSSVENILYMMGAGGEAPADPPHADEWGPVDPAVPNPPIPRPIAFLESKLAELLVYRTRNVDLLPQLERVNYSDMFETLNPNNPDFLNQCRLYKSEMDVLRTEGAVKLCIYEMLARSRDRDEYLVQNSYEIAQIVREEFQSESLEYTPLTTDWELAQRLRGVSQDVARLRQDHPLFKRALERCQDG